MTDSQLTDAVRALMQGNRVQAVDGRYTRPAHLTYPHQWLWDSCFHAVIYDALGDKEYARDEVRALFRQQEAHGPDRGRIPHMTFVGGHASEIAQDAQAAGAYARDVALWGNTRASTITQPPILAEAVLRIGDASFWREVWHPLSAFYDFWLNRRDPDGDHLYSTWHVWESGADATPRADAACARLLRSGRVPRAIQHQTINPTAKKRGDLLAARFLMLEDLQAIDGMELAGTMSVEEAQRRREALFGHESIDMQAYLVRNLVDLAHIGEELGLDAEATRYRDAASHIIEAVNAKLWDEADGFYFDREGTEESVLRTWTAAPFVALYAYNLVPRARAERLLAHLMNDRMFWTRWPVPTVSRHDPRFDPDEYWRGSTWINVNWFIVRGLLHAANRFEDERYLVPATAIAQRTLDLVSRAGFREYYRSGGRGPDDEANIEAAGFGPERFSWSGLIVDFARILETDLGGADTRS